MTERKRLHVSPLNSDLLPVVLSQSLLQQSSNISYHTIETFPEKNYGYVDLPILEAEKLRKKLNGSVLRGFKMRVEEARPKKSAKRQDDTAAEEAEIKKTRPTKKKPAEEGVIPGVELPKERKVKRGWTEPEVAESKSTKKRKEKTDKKPRKNETSITGQSECLFKTKLPPNAASASSEKGGKAKKRKRGDPDRDMVVHEFTNNTKHATFLRDGSDTAGKKRASEYVEGQGWVDQDGHLVEAEPKTRRPRNITKDTNKDTQEPPTGQVGRTRSGKTNLPAAGLKSPINSVSRKEVDEDETSSSGISNSDDDAENPVASPPAEKPTNIPHWGEPPPYRGEPIGLGINKHVTERINTDRVGRLSITRSSPPSIPEANDQATSAPPAIEVHPLEAIFKQPKGAASQTPKKPHLEVSTSFSFFDPDVEEEEKESADTGLLIPQTPYSQQDFRYRRQRSAAPTPDTAAPGRSFGNVWGSLTDDESETDWDQGKQDQSKDLSKESSAPETKQGSQQQESEFSKWFWEHRGENNRAWKRRRREAAKEKRQRGNKELQG